MGIPHFLQDRLPADHRPRILGQQGQQVELLGRQGHFDPVDEHPAGPAVDDQSPEHLGLVRTGRLVAAPHDRSDPGDELAEAEGLDDVVIRAELQPHYPVDLGAARRDDQDRDR